MGTEAARRRTPRSPRCGVCVSPRYPFPGPGPGPWPGTRSASSAGHRERLLQRRRRAVARVDVDLARLHDELAPVVVESEVALVERKADRQRLAGRERHALEAAQPPDRLLDA